MTSTKQSELRNAVELTLIPGLGIRTRTKLYAAHPRMREVFGLPAGRLRALGVSAAAAAALSSRRYQDKAEEIIDWAEGHSCRILLRGHRAYPPLLEEIHDPPLLLYAQGDTSLLDRPGLAVVGSRRPTVYGLQMAEGLAADLGGRGITIVSGLARGIDGAAHRACLRAGGRTIAVLGCGIDVTYPREHHLLKREIAEEGLLLAELTPGTTPSPQNFPVRNRIISGLSVGILVVEASEKSGSLITARLALEQNRDVFAVPGNLTSPQSVGPNFLIKQGAKLVQSWRDVVEEFPLELQQQVALHEGVTERSNSESHSLGADETRVLGLIAPDRATHFDYILRMSGLDIAGLSAILFKLEVNGRVRPVPGNLFVRVAGPEKSKQF